jgi:lipopolysaccharide transport system ATP-binding protein
MNEENNQETIIEVKNLTRIFRKHHESSEDVFSKIKSCLIKKNGYEELNVLDGISFELKKGEMLGILGRNGSGKTTLLKIIGKILKPTSGDVKINGNVSSLLSLGSGFHPDLSVKQNVILYGIILGKTKEEMKKKLPEVIKFAELEEFADSKFKDFSTGMKMRLALSTALCVDPDVLLVDEIIAVGDYAFQKKSTDEFLKIKNAGKSIIFVSHSLDQIKQFCDRVILLEKGKIMKVGKPDEVIETYVKFMSK